MNAMKFLETIADPKTSLEFNKLKGSVPIRTDVDVASLPPTSGRHRRRCSVTRSCCR